MVGRPRKNNPGAFLSLSEYPMEQHSTALGVTDAGGGDVGERGGGDPHACLMISLCHS